MSDDSARAHSLAPTDRPPTPSALAQDGVQACAPTNPLAELTCAARSSRNALTGSARPTRIELRLVRSRSYSRVPRRSRTRRRRRTLARVASPTGGTNSRRSAQPGACSSRCHRRRPQLSRAWSRAERTVVYRPRSRIGTTRVRRMKSRRPSTPIRSRSGASSAWTSRVPTLRVRWRSGGRTQGTAIIDASDPDKWGVAVGRAVGEAHQLAASVAVSSA